jgi:hypothetical protein
MQRGRGQEFWTAVLSDVVGLRWVLENLRMAWTSGSASRASQIRPGDGLVLYVARGAFNNPTRDRSQLAGVAEVGSPVVWLREPVVIAGREFVCACNLRLDAVLPEREGVPVHSLVPRLTVVRRKEVWGQYFRSGLVHLPERDFNLMVNAIRRAGRGGRRVEGSS